MDHVSKEKRSWNMSRIHSCNTSPELTVRKILYHNGFRYRLHNKSLPGKPDIVLPYIKTVVFVHGCFWHRHHGCKRASTPSSNLNYWNEKFKKNIDRDIKNINALRHLGWTIFIIWECKAISSAKRLVKILKTNQALKELIE